METQPPAPPGWAKSSTQFLPDRHFSIFGSGLVQFALVWYLTPKDGFSHRAGDSIHSGHASGNTSKPLAGTLTDRWNRRTIMIVADASIALATVVLAILFAASVIQVWHIYRLPVLRSVGGISISLP